MLAAFVGCAGVGKNTIIKELIAAHPQRYAIFPTLTTRAMREGETEGNPYHFVTKEKFKALIDEGEIYEWQIIHDGNYYGGSRGVLKKHLESGKTLIKDIDVLGAVTYKQKLSDITKILSVFLYVEDPNVLLNRMRLRGDSEADIKIRAERFKMEMESSINSDYMVSNDIIKDTTDEVNCLLENEEALGGLYRPAFGMEKPTEAEIDEWIIKIESGEELPASELKFNGKELLLNTNIAAYVAAKRKGTFIQKKIKTLTDESIKAADISLNEWADFTLVR